MKPHKPDSDSSKRLLMALSFKRHLNLSLKLKVPYKNLTDRDISSSSYNPSMKSIFVVIC